MTPGLPPRPTTPPQAFTDTIPPHHQPPSPTLTLKNFVTYVNKFNNNTHPTCPPPRPTAISQSLHPMHALPPLRPHYLFYGHTTSKPTITHPSHENQDLSVSLFPRCPLALPDDQLSKPGSSLPVTPPDLEHSLGVLQYQLPNFGREWQHPLAFRNFASALVLSNMCGPPHSGAMSSPPALRICGSPCTIMHFKLGNNYCNLSSLIVKLWLMILIVH